MGCDSAATVEGSASFADWKETDLARSADLALGSARKTAMDAYYAVEQSADSDDCISWTAEGDGVRVLSARNCTSAEGSVRLVNVLSVRDLRANAAGGPAPTANLSEGSTYEFNEFGIGSRRVTGTIWQKALDAQVQDAAPTYRMDLAIRETESYTSHSVLDLHCEDASCTVLPGSWVSMGAKGDFAVHGTSGFAPGSSGRELTGTLELVGYDHLVLDYDRGVGLCAQALINGRRIGELCPPQASAVQQVPQR